MHICLSVYMVLKFEHLCEFLCGSHGCFASDSCLWLHQQAEGELLLADPAVESGLHHQRI